MLPANVRLDWKVIARHKHSSLFGLVISNEGKKFYKTDTRTLSGHDPGLVDALGDVVGVVDGDIRQPVDAGDPGYCHLGQLKRIVGYLEMQRSLL